MAYTDIDDPSAYFQAKTYTGNGSGSHAITLDGNSNMQPDWVWIKKRNGAVNHLLHDSVRGVTKLLVSNTTGADDVNTNILLGFDSNGFRVGANSASNNNNDTFVAWNWKAGTSFSNDASSTGVGNIDSAGSVNTDAGFSIITYTGSSSTNTVAHGLGVAPTMMIIKNRTSAYEWAVFHQDLAANHNLYLNTTAAAAQSDVGDIWSSTAPSSTVFTVTGNDIYVNYGSQNYVAYCFAEKQGYSKFGSYTGNGSGTDGTFVYTGFLPAFIMFKSTSTTGGWEIHDNKRDAFNVSSKRLFPNLSNAEATEDYVDFVSNGFKFRTSDANGNTSGTTYIYMAFAESPFVTSTGIPTTAR